MKPVVLLLVLRRTPRQPPPPGTPPGAQGGSFKTPVQPRLAGHSHNANGPRKQWAQLRLDSREALLAGGESGPAVVPGKPGESLLIRAVQHTAGVREMPSKQDKLSARQIADLIRWVEMGAPYPATISRTGARN